MNKIICILTMFLVSTVIAQSNSSPRNPKIIETPLKVIELNSSDLPTTAMPKMIFQCRYKNKVVYVDNPKKPGISNCRAIDQSELTKYQPKPDKRAAIQTPTLIDNDNALRPNAKKSINTAVNTQKSSAYRPPCGGVITYKDKTFLLPNDQPCPIPDEVLNAIPEIQAN